MRNKLLLFFLLLSTITYSQVIPLSFLKTRQATMGYNMVSTPTAPVTSSNLVLNLDAGLDESYLGTGTSWNDLSRRNDGTMSNVGYSASPRSLVFNGTTSKVEFSKGITEGDYLTYETWINPSFYGGPNDLAVIANLVGFNVGNLHFQFHGDKVNFDLRGVSYKNSNDISSGIILPLNQWNQIVFVYSAKNKTLKFYVNGELNISINLDLAPQITSSAFTIGAWNGGRYFKGKIAVLRAYDIALDATQVLGNYNALKPRFAPTATLTGTQSICSGGTANLTLNTTGTGSIKVTLTDGTEVNTVSGTSTTFSVTPTTNTTYTISSVVDQSPHTGTSTSSATVSIYEAAAITSQPVSPLTIIEGTTTTLSVTATGEPTLNYQWYKDGTAINGANDYSYTTTNTLSAEGTYYVTVSTTCNVVSSTTSTVSVTAMPQGSLSGNTIGEGQTGQLTYTSSNGTGNLFTIVYQPSGGSNVTVMNVTSGVAFNVASGTPSSTTTYTLISVTDQTTTTSRTSGFEAATATITIRPQGSLTGSTINNGQTGHLTYTSSNGGGPFTIVYLPSGGSNVTVTNVTSGATISVTTGTPTSTTTYTLVSVTDETTTASRTSGFTGGTATITVNATHYVGESFGGGIVFYITNGGAHGLIAETQDQSFNIPILTWYDAQTNINYINYHSTAGKLFNDWRVPTKDELHLLYLQKVAGIVSGFQDNGYWSSTSYNPNEAYVEIFDQIGNTQFYDDKFTQYYVRAIRSF